MSKNARNFGLMMLAALSTLITLPVRASEKTGHETRLTNQFEFLQCNVGGIWEIWRDEEHQNIPWQKVALPHCFNAFDAVDPVTPYYQGEGWYRAMLGIDNPFPSGRTLLHFEGAGQKTRVFVHTQQAGSHVGGYDEFTVDLTDALQAFKENVLFKTQYNDSFPVAIACDNSRDLQMIPSDLSDFNLYGGLYRYVNLVYVPAISLERIAIVTNVDINGKNATVSVKSSLYNPGSVQSRLQLSTELISPAGKILYSKSIDVGPGQNSPELVTLNLKKPQLWSPANPALYECRVTLKSDFGEQIKTEKFGFRHFEFKEKGPFYLNGQRLLLRGTHRHEDHAGTAAAMTDAMIRQEMKLVKEMGANFIRLGHYQQSRIVLNLCDSLGILVWEEIPWCRGGLGGQGYQQQALRMLTNMIQQHANHPSIVLWGLGNENDWDGDFETFSQDSIRHFMRKLHDLAHQLDPSRLTSIRRCRFCSDIPDVYSPSIWAGWYRGQFSEYQKVSYEEMNKVKRFFHAEWGGDSHAGRYSENPLGSLSSISTGQGADERAGDFRHVGGTARVSRDGDWSESYFCDLVDWHLKEQEKMDWLTGSAQWIFKDFSTPLRPENPIPFMNQKGVVQRDLTKKEGFFVFQSYWNTTPMVHIFGHQWDIRGGEPGELKLVKVYSNCETVELFVNGKSAGSRKRASQDFPAAGLRWQVVLQEGQNRLEAIGKNGNTTIRDQIELEYQTGAWGKPEKLTLETVSISSDTAVVKAELLDKDGKRCLDARHRVQFGLAGEGKMIDNLGTVTGSRIVELANGRASIKIKMNAGKSCASVTTAGVNPAFLLIEAQK